jgi:hypothetical protein
MSADSAASQMRGPDALPNACKLGRQIVTPTPEQTADGADTPHQTQDPRSSSSPGHLKVTFSRSTD